MEPEIAPQIVETKNVWNQVTPLSKYLAMALFVALPFIGGWVGYSFVPGKTVQIDRIKVVEKEVKVEVPVEKIVVIDIDSRTSYRNEQLGIEFMYPTAYGSTTIYVEKGDCPQDYAADSCDQQHIVFVEKNYEGGRDTMLVTETPGHELHPIGRDGFWGDQAGRIGDDYLELCKKDEKCTIVTSDFGVRFAKYTGTYGPGMGTPPFDIEYIVYKEGEQYSGYVLAPISSKYYENPVDLFENTVIKSFKFIE